MQVIFFHCTDRFSLFKEDLIYTHWACNGVGVLLGVQGPFLTLLINSERFLLEKK